MQDKLLNPRELELVRTSVMLTSIVVKWYAENEEGMPIQIADGILSLCVAQLTKILGASPDNVITLVEKAKGELTDIVQEGLPENNPFRLFYRGDPIGPIDLGAFGPFIEDLDINLDDEE